MFARFAWLALLGLLGGSACAGRQPPIRCADLPAAGHAPFRAVQALARGEQVRVLVYGQSVSQGAWWSKTKHWLEQTYPDGRLIMENHARGGCSAQCLIGHERWTLDGRQYNRLPEDVFGWKPDLIIFHVYGDHVDYGYILRAFHEGCAAFDDYQTHDGRRVPEVSCTPEQRALARDYRAPEVLVQNDFLLAREPMVCPAEPTAANWSCFMNEHVIPREVARHRYMLQDNFHEWPRYLANRPIALKDLLQADQTHLSEPAGTDIMFLHTIRHLCASGS